VNKWGAVIGHYAIPGYDSWSCDGATHKGFG